MQKISKIIYLYCLWLSPILLYAQTTPPDIEWERSILDGYIFSNTEIPLGSLKEIHEMPDSGFTFVIHAEYTSVDIPIGGCAYWLKLDKHGRLVSRKKLATNATDIGATCPTSDGGVVICNREGYPNLFFKIRKFGAISNFPEWTVDIPYLTMTTSQVIMFDMVRQTTDGGYIFIGESNQQTGNYASAHSNTIWSGYVQDLIIAKYSATGQLLWCKPYGGFGDDDGIDIKPTADGGYICLGASTSFENDGQPCPIALGGYTACRPKIWLFKIDALGNMEWQKILPPNYNLTNHPSALDIAIDGGYIVSALTNLDVPCLPISHFSILKTDTQGELLWQTDVPAIPCGSPPIYVNSTPDGGFVASGEVGDVSGTPGNVFIVKGNSNGTIEWTKRFDRGKGNCIKPTKDNGYILLSGLWDNDTIRRTFVCNSLPSEEYAWITKLSHIPTLPPAIQGDTLLSCTTNTTLSVLNDPRSMAITGYAWSNGSTTQNININPPLGETTYTVTITYDNRCTRTITQKVHRNGFLIITPIGSTPTACNAATGAVTLSASGRSPWVVTSNNGIVNGMSITALAAGTYNITVTDANNCTGTIDITIGLPPNNISLTANILPAICNVQGSASITTTGGSAPYTYTCASGSISANTISGLSAGNYTVNVTDANGCTGTTSITIPQAANDLIVTATATQIPCANGTGSISVSVTNGIAPYTVNYTSTNGTNGSTTTTSNTVNLPSSGGGGGGFGAGDYTVVFTDFTGCTASVSTTINAAPLPLTATLTAQNTTCGQNNGSLTANINGGTAPYTLTYTNNGTSQDTTTASNTVRLPSLGGAGGGFAAGLHSVSFSDVNGCTFASSATINGNPPITATITTTPTKCYGEASGTIAISNVQNAVLPVLYSIDNQPLNATNPIVNVLGGTHNITIEDATGCKLTATATVTEGLKFEIYAGRDTLLNLGDSLVLSANIKSGFPLPPTTYSWTCTPVQPLRQQGAGAKVRPTSEAICTVSLVDSRGCRAEDALLIKLKDANGIFIPNIFTPNADGYNDDFVIFAGAMVERIVLLQIFDRWGALVHQKTDFAPNTPAWDGVTERYRQLQGVGNVGIGNVMQGVYVYRTEIRLRTGELKTLTGDVTLLR